MSYPICRLGGPETRSERRQQQTWLNLSASAWGGGQMIRRGLALAMLWSVPLVVSCAADAPTATPEAGTPVGSTPGQPATSQGTTPSPVAPDPKDPNNYAAVGESPSLTQPDNCLGIAGICLGAPLETVTVVLGIEEQREASSNGVERTWNLPWGMLTVTTDGVDSIQGVRVSVVETPGAQVSAQAGVTIGHSTLAEAQAALNAPAVGPGLESIGMSFQVGEIGDGPDPLYMVDFRHMLRLANPNPPEAEWGTLTVNSMSVWYPDEPLPPSTTAPAPRSSQIPGYATEVLINCGLEIDCVVNVRRAPLIESEIIETLAHGYTIQVDCQVRESMPWLHIVGGGYVRYDALGEDMTIDLALDSTPSCAPA